MSFKILICLLCGLLVSCELRNQEVYETYILPHIDKELCEEAKNMDLELNSFIMIKNEKVYEIIAKNNPDSRFFSGITDKPFYGFCALSAIYFNYSLYYNNNLDGEDSFYISFDYGFINAPYLKFDFSYQIGSKDFVTYSYYDPDFSPSYYGDHFNPEDPWITVSFGYYIDESNQSHRVLAIIRGVDSDINIKIKAHGDGYYYY